MLTFSSKGCIFLIVVKTRSLKLLMAERGYATQQALADRIEMDNGQLNRYVTGRRAPGPNVLDRLCKALECQPGDILEYRPG